MKLNIACMAKPAHVRFLDNRRTVPVVVGKKRFDDIVGRSRMDKKLAAAAQAQEDLRYMQYLKDGSDWLCSRFPNKSSKTRDEERREKLEQEIKDAEIRSKQTKIENDLLRKQRILRAQSILNDLKPSQLSLHHAMIESDMIYQRKYNDAVNRDIQEDARRQRKIDDEMCPEISIALEYITDEELKARDEAKKMMLLADNRRAIKEKREKKLAEDEQEMRDLRAEQARCQYLYEEEQKEVERRKQQKSDLRRRAYQDDLKDKAAVRKYEQIRNDIENRINCVDVTKRFVIGKRYNDQFNAMIGKQIKDREDRALEIYRRHQGNKPKAIEVKEDIEDKYEKAESIRQAQRDKLSKERRAYEQEERKRAAERLKPDAEIRRFQFAERLKNVQTNTQFYTLQEQRRDQKKTALKNSRNIEREEFIRRRDEEKMILCIPEPDPYVSEDMVFFDCAKKAIETAKMTGRPVHPLAKAVESYTRNNQIVLPEVRKGGRKKMRDNCSSGYYSKAEEAYKNYAAREECRQANMEKIYKDYIKIKQIAAEDHPHKKCEMQCPDKCQGLPCAQGPAKGKTLSKAPLQKIPSAVLGTAQLELKEKRKCSQTSLAKTTSVSKSVWR